jgi:hypothetical protein
VFLRKVGTTLPIKQKTTACINDMSNTASQSTSSSDDTHASSAMRFRYQDQQHLPDRPSFVSDEYLYYNNINNNLWLA